MVTPAETALQDPSAANNADPWNGREWITNVGAHLDLNVDREYACIFPLTAPRDCSKNASGAYNVPANEYSCDCSSTGLTADELSPVCDPTNATSQLYAKAYPTIRELELASKLGSQGIASSICPIDVTDNTTNDDPLYGYRPAVASIINRLKNALTNQCLPQQLTPIDGRGDRAVLDPRDAADRERRTRTTRRRIARTRTSYPGMSAARSDDPPAVRVGGAPDVAGSGARSAPNPSTLPTCQVNQLTGSQLVNGSCKASNAHGWCYVTGSAAGTCAQAILFSPGTLPTGSQISLQCIETSSALAAGQSGDGG